ncbi:ATP-binding protein [Bdellovibrionota bacterium FG-2]
MTNSKKFPWRLFSRIVLIQALLVLVAVAVSGVAARYFYKRQFLAQVESQLHVTLERLSDDLPANVTAQCCVSHSHDSTFRLTLISPSGQVLCDSHHGVQTMENHLRRPEVQAALSSSSGFGQSVRYSETLSERMLYGALNIKSKSVILRGAIPLSNLMATLQVLDSSLMGFLVLIGLVLGGFALWSGRKLALPLGRLLLKAENVAHNQASDERFEEDTFGELSELDSSLENIRRDLEAKAENLNRERDEQATLMSAISDAIIAVDLEGTPLFYNSRFAVLFGGQALRAGRVRLWELFRDPEVLDAFRMALTEGRNSSISAHGFDHSEGRRFFSLSVAPLRRTSIGGVYGAVGVFHDVTALKKAEQIRIDFVANVSHELRTPLTAIKGYTDTLEQDIGQGRAVSKEFVEVISRNTARLMSLINDLLDLSSLDANADNLQRAELSTEEISTRVLKQLSGAFEAKKQKVAVQAAVSSVYADATRLEQVLVNLLDNAAKYTPSGGQIKLSWEKTPSNEVLLKVSDSGPGIPAEHHERLFERFYRVDKARSRELGGTGLGLAIVKHIMQRHDGSVWVESTVGQGASFVCRFPGEA